MLSGKWRPFCLALNVLIVVKSPLNQHSGGGGNRQQVMIKINTHNYLSMGHQGLILQMIFSPSSILMQTSHKGHEVHNF